MGDPAIGNLVEVPGEAGGVAAAGTGATVGARSESQNNSLSIYPRNLYYFTQPCICTGRVVQLNLTPEIEIFYMRFDRSLPIFSRTSLKQYMEYFNFRC